MFQKTATLGFLLKFNSNPFYTIITRLPTQPEIYIHYNRDIYIYFKSENAQITLPEIA